MEISAFIFDLSKGGAQNVFVNVVNYLDSKNYDVKVIAQNTKDAVYLGELNQGVPVISLEAKNSKTAIINIFEYVRMHDLELALVFSHEIAIYLYLARKFFHKNYKIIGRCLNTISREYGMADTFFRRHVTHRMIKMFYHKIDYIIAQSTGMKEDLVNNYKVKASKIEIINNPVSPQFEQERQNLKMNKKENFIMYAGRLETQKGLDMLLKAFAGVEDRSLMLYIIGDGSLKKKLEELSNQLKIDQRVKFVEYTRNIIDYYTKAKATVLTSLYEGFPNVLVESISCGTPVVSYDLPSGPKEIIIDGVNGLLVNYRDIDAMTKAINKTVKYKWDQQRIKETANRYSTKAIIGKYESMLNKIHKGDSPNA